MFNQKPAHPHPPSVERIEELGIVGAGGGGFPAHVKFKARVSMLIANAAECEPLLHKDKELLHHHVRAVPAGDADRHGAGRRG